MNQTLKSRYLSYRNHYAMTAAQAFHEARQTVSLFGKFCLWQSRQPRADKVHPLSCRGTYESIMQTAAHG